MKVLIIGLGSIAAKHYTAIKNTAPEALIYALRSTRDAPPYRDVINLHSWSDLPDGITFAIVSNSTHLHTATVRQLIDLRIPIFLEKPLSNTLEDLDYLAERIRNEKIPTYVACNLRFHTSLLFLRQYLLDWKPRINEVNIYCGSYLPEWRPGKDFKNIYSARSESGGGVHLDLFHELDYACWLWGLPQQFTQLTASRSSLDITAADYANYQLIYPDFVTQITLNYYRRDARRTIEILTENNTILLDLLANTIKSSNGETLFEDPQKKILDTYTSQMQYFIERLQSGSTMMNSFDESLKILKICLNNGNA